MRSLWQELQDLEWEMYLESPDGVFSVDGIPGARLLGRFMNTRIPGCRCLDIGCGALSLPSYMKNAPNVSFVGVDPYEGDKKREFDFKRGYAEFLPFLDREFDGAVIATSLDHFIDPKKAIEEAHRVLKDNGVLFVWVTLRDDDDYYKEWEKTAPSKFDDYHMWAFTERTFRGLYGGLFDAVFRAKVPKRKLEFVYILNKI